MQKCACIAEIATEVMGRGVTFYVHPVVVYVGTVWVLRHKYNILRYEKVPINSMSALLATLTFYNVNVNELFLSLRESCNIVAMAAP